MNWITLSLDVFIFMSFFSFFQTGYSYGFGFVNYCKEEDASRAIGTLNGLQVQNKRLKVSYARPAGEEIKETNLYVTNLPRNVTEQEIEDIFGRFGNIVQKNILKDKVTGMPRGVAFVRLASIFFLLIYFNNNNLLYLS